LTLAALLGAACKKKDSARGDERPPAQAQAIEPALTVEGEPVEADLVEAAVVDEWPEGIDPRWLRELAPLPGRPDRVGPLARMELPEELRARAEARLPELIGSCATSDLEQARWSAARGGHLYLAAACWEGRTVRAAVLAVDGERIAPVGIEQFEADTPMGLDIAEGAGAVCLSWQSWSACFAVDERALADRATRGPVATRLASCPDAVAAIAACQSDDAFVKAIADGSSVGAAPDDARGAIAAAAKSPAAVCAEWIEQPAVGRRWTVPLDDFDALTAAAAGGCTALAATIVDAGGLPYRTAQ
jgi:hypothetical protein